MKILSLFFFLLCSFDPKPAPDMEALSFLAGTWKEETKENYECWQKAGNGLTGYAYEVKQGRKVITERFSITAADNKIIYTATVPDQNRGRPVAFILNKSLPGTYSFENAAHDFPRKIRYTKINDTLIGIDVLGDHDKGFSYKMSRCRPE